MGALGGVRRAWLMLRHLGPGWMAFRVGYAVRSRLGALVRSSPVGDWTDYDLSAVLCDSSLSSPERYLEHRRQHAPRFLFSPDDRLAYEPLLEAFDAPGGGPLEEVDRLLAGEVRFFGHDWRRLGMPPAWHAIDGACQGVHWSRISDFGSGDIKETWEPSRFGFVYALVRLYWRTGQPGLADAFWRLVCDWRETNPPNCGVNWKCGQEATFRMMAWCFGLYGFLHAKETTAERVAMLAGMVAATARRIEANIDYALSQDNNHGVSEGAGLLSAALLFPELRGAERWERRGRQVLADLADQLIYDDGAFAQHSLNYHRVMLDVYLWAIRLAELSGRPLPDRTRERVARSGQFLLGLVDPANGLAPMYGHSDGAQVLPLANGPYSDYRPTAVAAGYLGTGTRRLAPGAHDEQLLWLFGPEALRCSPTIGGAMDLAAPSGGCWTIGSGASRAFLRSQSYRHRPAHADQLHMDLVWRGQPIAVDGGTYSYNAPAPWCNPFAGAYSHNTVMVDGRDQMELAGRFLWLPWCRGEAAAVHRTQAGHVAAWRSSHDGYRRLADPVGHRRVVVQMAGEWWLVLDLMDAKLEHTYRLHWMLADVPYKADPDAAGIVLSTSAGDYRLITGVAGGGATGSVVRCDECGPRGWRATHYSAREPAVSVALEAARDRALFWSLFGPGATTVEVRGHVVEIASPGLSCQVRLVEGAGGFDLGEVNLCSPVNDYLRIGVADAGRDRKEHA